MGSLTITFVRSAADAKYKRDLTEATGLTSTDSGSAAEPSPSKLGTDLSSALGTLEQYSLVVTNPPVSTGTFPRLGVTQIGGWGEPSWALREGGFPGRMSRFAYHDYVIINVWLP
jgi:hypothetical protein